MQLVDHSTEEFNRVGVVRTFDFKVLEAKIGIARSTKLTNLEMRTWLRCLCPGRKKAARGRDNLSGVNRNIGRPS